MNQIPNPSTRADWQRGALEWLVKYDNQDPRVGRVVLDALQENNRVTRRLAIKLLGSIQEPKHEILSAIDELLSDNDPVVRTLTETAAKNRLTQPQGCLGFGYFIA